MYRKDDDNDNNNLFEFIDSIGSEVNKKKHIVIFYEESERARNIEFRFIKNGLLKNEHCIYTVAEEGGEEGTKEDVISFIEREMNDYGIDVYKYNNKNDLLHIYQTPYPLANQKDIINNREIILKTLLAGLKPPFRIANNTLIPELKTREQIRANIEIERKIRYDFNNNRFPGSFMCSYHIKNIISDIRGEWMRNMLLNHQNVIFLPKLSNGLVLNLS
jgi:hypothetical protein